MCGVSILCLRKKEEIWLSRITKAPTLTDKSKTQRDVTKTQPKTSITQRLKTGSRGNDSHQTGVIKPVYGIPTFQQTSTAV